MNELSIDGILALLPEQDSRTDKHYYRSKNFVFPIYDINGNLSYYRVRKVVYVFQEGKWVYHSHGEKLYHTNGVPFH